MKLESRTYADTVVVAPTGRLDHDNCEAFRAGLEPHLDLAAANREHIVLDLSGLEYVSSAGLRCFMLAAKEASARNSALVVAAMHFFLTLVFLDLVQLGLGDGTSLGIVWSLLTPWVNGFVAAWLLVALAEFAAERIDRSPLSYLLPAPAPEAEEEEPQQVFGLRPEERTVVAAPEPAAEPPASEAVPAAEQIPAPEAEPEAVLEPEPEPEPEPESEPARPALGKRLRRFTRRREPEVELEPPSPPRHVKLLPRRPAPEPSEASQEVAELFDEGPTEEDAAQPEETRT